jgi:predicted GNAT family N-acyltransferase
MTRQSVWGMLSAMSFPLILDVPISSDLGRLAFALRYDVFVDEQRVPVSIERDAYDETATHIVAVLEGDVVGVLRVVFLPEHAKFGRVAVARQTRGKGIASAMMRFAMDLAVNRGEKRFYLTSQTDKLPLYEKLGFVAFGEEFTEGGMPHRSMRTY